MSLSLEVDLSDRIVKNEFPSIDRPYRIALIGEAPGSDEVEYKRPFVGKSGNFLDNMLHASNIDRRACFIGNVCQLQPPGNKIEKFSWDGAEIQGGLTQLAGDLATFKPNICVLLGNTPLRSAKYLAAKVGDWQNSMFKSVNVESPFFGYKCISTFHPAYIIRPPGYPMRPMMTLALDRAREEGEHPDLYLPQRRFELDLTADEIISRLNNWPKEQRMSIDIEGVLGNWSMVSVSDSPTTGFVVCWYKFTVEEECAVLRAFSQAMWDIDIPKTLQNCLYDTFVMMFGHKILVRNVHDDTMLKSWEIYPELPKGLEFQAAMWTREPNWKQVVAHTVAEKKRREKAGLVENPRDKERYCCLDSAVTEEIALAQDAALTPKQRKHYEFNKTLLRPLLYMENLGHRYDIEGAKELLLETELGIKEYKNRLDVRTRGVELFGAKGGFSPIKLADYLYSVRGFPTQYKKEHGKLTDNVATDTPAILVLAKKFEDPVLAEILKIKKDLKIAQYLSIKADPDGRVRCGYNIVGTETGRLSCYESPTGSGTNLTTITKKLRRLYLADIDHDYFQCDLSGADGWTVACHCSALGDDTMLEDLYYGIKPSKVIALMYLHGAEIGKMGRAELKERCDSEIDKNGWLYYACKKVFHGTNYGLGEVTMQDQIMEDSYKETGTPIFVLTQDIRKLKALYLEGRYKGVNRWHRWAANELLTKGELTGASGHTRQFLGKKKDGRDVYHATLREFLADEPQENTTYATNLAMYRLWMDPENRVEEQRSWGTVPRLLIQPIHQVHDALNGQWHQGIRDWAREKVKSYFNNEIVIADIKLTIPFEGNFGPSWGETSNSI